MCLSIQGVSSQSSESTSLLAVMAIVFAERVLATNIRTSMNMVFDVRFEAFTAVTMKNVVFWDVALCRTWVDPTPDRYRAF
jgi:hypothetical protein